MLAGLAVLRTSWR